MAAISTSIEIYDKVSKPINSIIAALGNVCDAFDSVERSMDGTFDTSRIEDTRRAVEKAALEMIQLGNDTQDVEKHQENYNRAVHSGSNAVDGLLRKVGGLVTAYVSLRGVTSAMGLSDTMTQTTARLDMMNDGLQTTEELQQMIYESAQRSRGSYQDTADVVAKLGLRTGDLFSNAEAVQFAENLNKMFVVAGASQAEMSSASLQLTQALGSGVLRGEELNAIFESAPNIIQTIADYLGVGIGEIRQMAADGQITADVIKNAMLGATSEIQTQFEQMPLTWNQMWTMMKNNALMAFQPVLQKISDIANNPGFQTFVSNMISGLSTIVMWLLKIIDVVIQVATFFSQNWSTISPIIWGVVTALGAYYALMKLTNIAIGINALKTNIQAAATAMSTGATFAQTAAQYGYNAALLACPLTWIVIAILAVIAAVMVLCEWIAKMTGAANSGFGMICGGVNVVIQFFKNLGLWVANIALGIAGAIGAVANNILAAFWNAICSVQSFFWGLLQTVMEVIEGVCRELNKIPFVEIDYSGVSNAADSYAAKKAQAENSKMDYQDIGAAFKNGYNTFDTFESGWVENAYNSGAAWGDGVSDGISNMFDTSGGNLFDSSAYGAGGYDESQVPSNIAGTAENTGKMADSMDITNEDLKYLRDIAEREVVNRFTTAEIKVEMTNNNNISSDSDLDGIVDYLVAGVENAMYKSAEGVHV